MSPQSFTAGNFEPKFYAGGGTRFYVPLLHDIMALEKPALVITLGLADAQPLSRRHHERDGHDAPGDAEHGEGRPQLVRGQRLQGVAEEVLEGHGAAC